jgi:CRP/FNR family transcriptional regulator
MPTLAKFTSEQSYERGQTIYCLDDPAEELYQIERGRVKIVRISPDGQQKILNIYQQSDFFGELCVCGGHTRTEQAVALEPVTVRSFQMNALMKLLSSRPELVLGLLQLFCARLGESYDHIAALAFDNIPRRLAREILRLSRAVEAESKGNGKGVTLNLTHEELAHLVGTSREMVTTMMTQFRQRGILNYTRGHIHVEPPRIEKFLKDSSG